MTSSSDIWLFNDFGDFIHSDGQSWTEEPTPVSGVALWYDAWGKGGDVWLTGSSHGNDQDWVLRHQGMKWVVDEQPWSEGGPAYGMDGLASDDLWRAGDGFVSRWDGVQWTPVSVSRAAIFEDVAATSRGVFAVGTTG